MKSLQNVQQCRDTIQKAKAAAAVNSNATSSSVQRLVKVLDLELSGSEYVFNPFVGRTNISLYPRKDMG